MRPGSYFSAGYWSVAFWANARAAVAKLPSAMRAMGWVDSGLHRHKVARLAETRVSTWHQVRCTCRWANAVKHARASISADTVGVTTHSAKLTLATLHGTTVAKVRTLTSARHAVSAIVKTDDPDMYDFLLLLEAA